MKKAKLGDICTIVSGSTPKTSKKEYWDGNLRWITPAEIADDSYFIYDTERYITEAGAMNAHLNLLPIGTVLLSSRAPIGKVAIAGAEMYCNQGFKNLICSPCVNNCYLYYYLKSKKDYLNSLGRGATFKEISRQIVSEIEIPLPELDEQQRIVRQFDLLAKLCNTKHQQIDLLELAVKSRFVEMFGNPVLNPTKWKYATLSSLTEVGSSKRIFEKEYVSEGVPFYRTKEIVELARGETVSKNLFISNERFEEIKKQFGVPHKNDLMISAVGTIGVIWVVDSENPFYFKDGNLLRVNSSRNFNSMFMKYLLEILIKYHKRTMSAGSAYAALTIKELSNLNVIMPPIDLQIEFSEFKEQVDKSRLAVQKSLDKLEILKKSLMQQYFG